MTRVGAAPVVFDVAAAADTAVRSDSRTGDAESIYQDPPRCPVRPNLR
jgi:hypothetical protein